MTAINRRQFFARVGRSAVGLSTLALTGCEQLNATPWFNNLLSLGT